mgnify:CR=1 FL=1
MKMLQAQRGFSRPDTAIARPVFAAALISSARLPGAILALDGNLLLRCP